MISMPRRRLPRRRGTAVGRNSAAYCAPSCRRQKGGIRSAIPPYVLRRISGWHSAAIGFSGLDHEACHGIARKAPHNLRLARCRVARKFCGVHQTQLLPFRSTRRYCAVTAFVALPRRVLEMTASADLQDRPQSPYSPEPSLRGSALAGLATDPPCKDGNDSNSGGALPPYHHHSVACSAA